MTSIEIKPVNELDISDESGFFDLFIGYDGGDNTLPRDEANRYFKENSDYTFYVAKTKRDKKIAAIGAANFDIGHIVNIYVDREFRNKGIATELIQVMVNQIKSKGCPKAILDCHDDKISFYEKFGFNQTGVCFGDLKQMALYIPSRGSSS